MGEVELLELWGKFQGQLMVNGSWQFMVHGSSTSGATKSMTGLMFHGSC